MATPPDGLTLEHDRDLVGRERRPVVRWALVALLGVLVVLGLLNVFGQRPSTTTETAPAAELKVYSPPRVRSGLLFESRFHVKAIRRAPQGDARARPRLARRA